MAKEMGRVFIDGLKLRGKHGVYDWEWEKEQEFRIDLSAEVDLDKAAASDKLEDTVCWTYMYEIAKAVISGPTVYLIERIADTIARRILEGEPRISSITVSVRKNEIWPRVCRALPSRERNDSDPVEIPKNEDNLLSPARPERRPAEISVSIRRFAAF